jgi:hypothetical protein
VTLQQQSRSVRQPSTAIFLPRRGSRPRRAPISSRLPSALLRLTAPGPTFWWNGRVGRSRELHLCERGEDRPGQRPNHIASRCAHVDAPLRPDAQRCRARVCSLRFSSGAPFPDRRGRSDLRPGSRGVHRPATWRRPHVRHPIARQCPLAALAPRLGLLRTGAQPWHNARPRGVDDGTMTEPTGGHSWPARHSDVPTAKELFRAHADAVAE